MYRTRRHWREVIAGLVLVISGLAIAVIPTLRAEGAYGLVPSRALVWLLPHVSVETQVFMNLEKRVKQSRLSDSTLLQMLRRCVEGDSSAPQGSRAWREKYLRLVNGQLAAAARPKAEQALFNLPVELQIDALNAKLDRWPESTKVLLAVRAKRPWRSDVCYHLRVIPNNVENEAITRCAITSENPAVVALEPLPPGEHKLSLRVEVGRLGETGHFESVQGRDLEVPITVVKAQPVRVVRDEVLARSLKRALEIKLGSVKAWAIGEYRDAMTIDVVADDGELGIYKEKPLAFVVEAVNEDVVVSRTFVWREHNGRRWRWRQLVEIGSTWDWGGSGAIQGRVRGSPEINQFLLGELDDLIPFEIELSPMDERSGR